jgi:hypothetical protein
MPKEYICMAVFIRKAANLTDLLPKEALNNEN